LKQDHGQEIFRWVYQDAVYRAMPLLFTRLKQPNPLRDNQGEEFVPCGVVAGIIARTDATRGVWKAPGLEATLVGVPQQRILTDDENEIKSAGC
jgi:hypothetical protein